MVTVKIQVSCKNIKDILEQSKLSKEEVIWKIDPTCIRVKKKKIETNFGGMNPM